MKNFHKDLSIMIGEKAVFNKMFYYWDVCWIALIPGLLVVTVTFTNKNSKNIPWSSLNIFKYLKTLTIFMFIQTTPIELPDYKFPYWTHIFGQCFSASTLSGIVFWAIWLIIEALFIHKKVNKIKKNCFYEVIKP